MNEGGCLIDADEGLLGFSDIADAGRRDSPIFRFADELLALVFGDRDEQSAGGLRIEKQSLEFGADGRFVIDKTFGKVAVVVQASGYITGANTVQSPWQD